MKKILISIIIPCYNSMNTIHNTLNSILVQSYENYEIILVDDCSTDQTRKIITSYNNPKIKVILLEKNQGVSNARNCGIKKAEGDYIVFIDSDDSISSNFLQSLVDNLESDKCLIRAFNFEENKEFSKEEYILKIITGKMLGVCWGYLIKKELCLNNLFDSDTSYMEDTIFIVNLINKFEKIKEISSCKYIYSNNENSLTRKITNPNKMLNGYFYSIDMLYEFVLKNKYDISTREFKKRKFVILKNTLMQASSKEIDEILNNYDNKRIICEYKTFPYMVFMTTIGRAFWKFRYILKILKMKINNLVHS